MLSLNRGLFRTILLTILAVFVLAAPASAKTKFSASEYGKFKARKQAELVDFDSLLGIYEPGSYPWERRQRIYAMGYVMIGRLSFEGKCKRDDCSDLMAKMLKKAARQGADRVQLRYQRSKREQKTRDKCVDWGGRQEVPVFSCPPYGGDCRTRNVTRAVCRKWQTIAKEGFTTKGKITSFLWRHEPKLASEAYRKTGLIIAADELDTAALEVWWNRDADFFNRHSQLLVSRLLSPSDLFPGGSLIKSDLDDGPEPAEILARRLDVLRFLFSKGASAEPKPPVGEKYLEKTPLMKAVDSWQYGADLGQVLVVKLLIEHGASTRTELYQTTGYLFSDRTNGQIKIIHTCTKKRPCLATAKYFVGQIIDARIRAAMHEAIDEAIERETGQRP